MDYESYLSYVEAYNTIKEYRNISMYIDDVFLYLPQSGEILSANSSIIPIDDIFLTMKESFEKDGVSFFHNNDALYYLSQGSNQVMVGIKISLLDIRYTLRGYDSEAAMITFSWIRKQRSCWEGRKACLKRGNRYTKELTGKAMNHRNRLSAGTNTSSTGLEAAPINF